MNEIKKEVVKMDKSLLEHLKETKRCNNRKVLSVYTVELLESLDKLNNDDVLKIKCDKKKANNIRSSIQYHVRKRHLIKGDFDSVYKKDEKMLYILRKEILKKE